MKTFILTTGVLLLVVCGCSSTRVTNSSSDRPFLSQAFFDERTPGKRLILKFEPDVPPYEVAHNRDARMVEVRWRGRARENVDKTFVFSGKGPGIKKAQLVVDAASELGVLWIWHEAGDGYSLTKQEGGELVLMNDDRQRQIAMARSVDARKRRVNLSVRGAPLEKIIRTLATESQKSLILGSSVGGTVSVTLNNMPYEQALDMILRPTPYRAEHAGDVTIIRSAKTDKTFRAFKVRYVDVNGIMDAVKGVASRDAQISTDANTNTLFVIDRFEQLKNLELALAMIDQEPRQVEVEAAILEMDSTDNLDYGFEFNSGNVTSGQVTGTARTSNINPVDAAAASAKGMFVGLTWQSVTGLMGMLASRGKLNLLARPRVLALTDQEASIVLGSRLGYKTLNITQVGTTEQIQFLTVGTQLKIKPHITMNNDIIMSIKPEISDGQVDPQTGVPSATTTTSETKVIAHNGQTIVIGGLLRDRSEKTTDRVPILGDIPLIGFFFSGNSSQSLKSEVIIMLSPKVVTTEVEAAYERDSLDHIRRFQGETGFTLTPGRMIP